LSSMAIRRVPLSLPNPGRGTIFNGDVLGAWRKGPDGCWPRAKIDALGKALCEAMLGRRVELVLNGREEDTIMVRIKGQDIPVSFQRGWMMVTLPDSLGLEEVAGFTRFFGCPPCLRFRVDINPGRITYIWQRNPADIETAIAQFSAAPCCDLERLIDPSLS